MPTKRWYVDIYITTEVGGDTHAKALLSTGDRMSVQGSGMARLTSDHSVPEIGDEFAAARALMDLGHRLLGMASADAAESTGEHLTPQRVQAWDI